MTGQLHIFLLGSFRLVRNGIEVPAKDWQTRQARQLLKVLLAERGHLVSSGRLVDLLWPEHVEHADKSLRSAVSALRDVLEPGREPWIPSSFVPRGRQGYMLIFPAGWRVWIDSYEFERLLEAGLEGTNTTETRALLEQALQLYTGDYLHEDGDAPWVLTERARLRERYFAGVLRLVKWQGDAGLYDAAIALGSQALALDPCREPLYRYLMQYQALIGDTAAALQTFEHCRQALDDHLGIDPSAQTLELHMAILQREFPRQMSAPPATTLVPENGTVRENHALTRQEMPFIGRRSELYRLAQHLLMVARLPQRTLDFVELAAVIGRPFPPALLDFILSAEDYRMLDILLKHGVLVETGMLDEGRVQLVLAHEVVGQSILASCSTAHISSLHSQIAQQMEHFYAMRIEPYAAEIALHYQQAGVGNEWQALRYTLQAAEYARRTFRFHQALKHYHTALELLQLQAEPLREEWLDKIYRGQSLVYEALLDWKGIQEIYHSVSTWATTKHDLVLANYSLYRMILARSLMGYCTEAADMGRKFIDLLQTESERLPTMPEQIQESLRLQMDLTRRWTQINAVYDAEDVLLIEGPDSELPAHFPPFSSAVSPAVPDWERAGEILGPAQSAVILTTYGWVLHLQGHMEDAERCLLAARKEAEATGQVVWWVLASLHLSRVYFSQGQFKQGMQEFEGCLERCKQVTEAPWLPMWPMLNQAYYVMSRGHLDEAERLFVLLDQQLASQDLPSYRYSAQIGLGLLALARRQVEQARTQLRALLAKKQSMYIETYVLAEIGLAEIDMQQGAHAEAYRRLYSMLALTGKRSLLELYTVCACTLARLSLPHVRQAQGVVPLLQDVHQRISTIGPNDLARECGTLLAQFSESRVS